jgi:AGZA family xanthine/uracil permease-like MFS transporter
MGLIPSLASWALLLVETALRKAGTTLFEAAPRFGGDLFVYGMIALSQGFLLSSMLLASILVFLIEREFLKAAAWALAAAVLSCIGLIHAYDLQPTGLKNRFGLLAAPDFAVAYALSALLFFILHFFLPQPHKLERAGNPS